MAEHHLFIHETVCTVKVNIEGFSFVTQDLGIFPLLKQIKKWPFVENCSFELSLHVDTGIISFFFKRND